MYIVVWHVAVNDVEVNRNEACVKFQSSMAAREYIRRLESKLTCGDAWYMRNIKELDGVTRCEVVTPLDNNLVNRQYGWFSVENISEEAA